MISSTEQYGLRAAGPLKPIRITPNSVTHPLKRQSIVIAGGPYVDIDSGRNSYANASPIEPLNRTAPFNVEELNCATYTLGVLLVLPALVGDGSFYCVAFIVIDHQSITDPRLGDQVPRLSRVWFELLP